MKRTTGVLVLLTAFTLVTPTRVVGDEGVQIMCIASGQKSTIDGSSRSVVIRAYCMQKGKNPPNAEDQFRQFSGGGKVTRDIGGTRETASFEKAVRDGWIRVTGEGATGVRFEVADPLDKATYTIEVSGPTVAVPKTHGLPEAELKARLKGVDAHRALIESANKIEQELRKQFGGDSLVVKAYNYTIQKDLYWGGKDAEFPWDAPPKELEKRFASLSQSIGKEEFRTAVTKAQKMRAELEKEFHPPKLEKEFRSPSLVIDAYDELMRHHLFDTDREGKLRWESDSEKLGKEFASLLVTARKARKVESAFAELAANSTMGDDSLDLEFFLFRRNQDGKCRWEGNPSEADKRLDTLLTAIQQARQLQQGFHNKFPGPLSGNERSRFADEFTRAVIEHFFMRIKMDGDPIYDPSLTELSKWPAGLLEKILNVGEDPILSYAQACFICEQELNATQVRFLQENVGREKFIDPKDSTRNAEEVKYIHALTALIRSQAPWLRADWREKIIKALQSKEKDQTSTGRLKQVYEKEAESFHREEISAAKNAGTLKRGDVVMHVFEGMALVSTHDSIAPQKLQLGSREIEAAVKDYNSDFSDIGGEILGMDAEELANRVAGKSGEKSSYFVLLKKLKDAIPPPVKGKKRMVYIQTDPRLRTIDFPMLYDLLNLAKVAGFDRDDIQWFEVIDRNGSSSALREATKNVRALEKFPKKTIDVLAVTIPYRDDKDAKDAFDQNLYGKYIQGKLDIEPTAVEKLTWETYKEKVVPAVKEMIATAKEAQDKVIYPNTLDEFIDEIKKLTAGNKEATITMTLLTHRDSGTEIVFFGQKEYPLREVLNKINGAQLPENVVFSLLSCGFARSPHVPSFFNETDIKLLIAPAEKVTLINACQFHTTFIRQRQEGKSILEAFDAARKARVDELRKMIKDERKPQEKSQLELPRRLVKHPNSEVDHLE